MSYDQDYDYFGTDPVLEDDQWLEELKSFLDETPTDAHPAGSRAARESRQQPRPAPGPYQPRPVQQQYRPDPRQQYPADPRRQNTQGMEALYGMPFSEGGGSQPSCGRDPYCAARPAAQPRPPIRAQQEERPRRRKHPYASIIVLSVIVLLEAAAIAAVAVQWITWMR